MRLLNKQRFSRLLAEEHISRMRGGGDEFTALGSTQMNPVALSPSELCSLLQQRRAFICPELTRAAFSLRNQPENKTKWPISSKAWRVHAFTLPTRAESKTHFSKKRAPKRGASASRSSVFHSGTIKAFFLKEINMISFFLAPTGHPTAPADGGGASSHLLSTCFAAIGMMWEELTAGEARPLQGPPAGSQQPDRAFRSGAGVNRARPEGHPPKEPTAKQTQRR